MASRPVFGLMHSSLSPSEASGRIKTKFQALISEEYREGFMTDDFVATLCTEDVTVQMIRLDEGDLPGLSEPAFFPLILVDLSDYQEAAFYPILVSFFDRLAQKRTMNTKFFPIVKYFLDGKYFSLVCNILLFI